MRTLNEHQVNPANDTIELNAVDEPSSAGANHHYSASWADKNGHLHVRDIVLQNGPINEVGVNGLTHEVLLAVVADRLRGFQSGPYACEENAAALDAIEDAQSHLMSRTRARIERGVEGTHTV